MEENSPVSLLGSNHFSPVGVKPFEVGRRSGGRDVIQSLKVKSLRRISVASYSVQSSRILVGFKY